MTKDLDITEVAVYDETGRSSLLGTFHGWDRRGDAWWAHVMVYGPRSPDSGSGQYRDTVPADRIVPLVYCAWNPIERQAYHRCEGLGLMSDHHKVWA